MTGRWLREHVKCVGGTKVGMLTYAELAEKAANLIYSAIIREAGAEGARVVKASSTLQPRRHDQLRRLQYHQLQHLEDRAGQVAHQLCRLRLRL